MSAQEIIEQIKAMPADERQEVVNFVQTSDHRGAKTSASETKRDMKALIKEVFDEHDELFRKLAQ